MVKKDDAGDRLQDGQGLGYEAPWVEFEGDNVRRVQVPMRITRKMKTQLDFIAANAIGRGQNDWLCRTLEPLLKMEAERLWNNDLSAQGGVDTQF